MRFAAIPLPQPRPDALLQPAASSQPEAARTVRAATPALPPAQDTPVWSLDLPFDLDQRVRLVGEW